MKCFVNIAEAVLVVSAASGELQLDDGCVRGQAAKVALSYRATPPHIILQFVD